jgi:hypothetical protein
MEAMMAAFEARETCARPPATTPRAEVLQHGEARESAADAVARAQAMMQAHAQMHMGVPGHGHPAHVRDE